MTGPADKIATNRTTTGGKRIYAGRRTAAHLDATDAALRKQHPGCTLRIIQACYNTGVPASAGTHDKDGCLDVYVQGLAYLTAQRFLREQGWAAWYRYPPKFGYHIHMISLGCPGPLGVFVPGQIADYNNHRTGLAGHAADNTWHPANIKSTIFDYAAWERQQEDDMPYSDWPQKDKNALAADVAKAVGNLAVANLGGEVGSPDGGGHKKRALLGVLSATYNRVGGGKK